METIDWWKKQGETYYISTKEPNSIGIYYLLVHFEMMKEKCDWLKQMGTIY